MLATQEHRGSREQFPRYVFFDLSLLHYTKESVLVRAPTSSILLVGIEDVLGRSEHRFVDVVGPAEFSQALPKIVLFRESG